jgi:hypothetical protein
VVTGGLAIMHKRIEPNLARGQKQEEVEKFTGFLLYK